jgi:hypothetical protein
VVEVPCRALLDQIAEAYSHADRNALMALYREDALVCSAAEPDTAVGRDELFGRADVLQRTQLIGAIDLISIDEAAGLIRANTRVAVGQGQYRTTERVWLLTFKEGLVHRQRVLGSRDEALALYAARGMDLGMNPAPAIPA